MEELQVIETTSGRQFKPWATKEDVQDPASVTALASEIAGGKQTIAQAINAKGGTASVTESFNELAQDIEDIYPNIIFQGMTVSAPIQILDFISDVNSAARLLITEINNDTLEAINLDNIFNNCTNLNTVILSQLKSISGHRTFYNCVNLSSVRFPELLSITGTNIFYGCKLRSVYMPKLTSITVVDLFSGQQFLEDINFNGLETISVNNTFKNCTSLTTVNMSQLTTISGASTFEGCTSLTAVNMPQLTTISGANTFKNCTSLTTVNLPQLTTISGYSTFEGCRNLSTITLNATDLYLGVTGCYDLVTINLPYAKIIRGGIMSYNSNLKTLNFPQVEQCDDAFTFYNLYYCTNVETIILGTIKKTFNFAPYNSGFKIAHFEIGADTNVNLNLSGWDPSNIPEGDTQMLNDNLYNYMLTRLYDHSQDGETRTLRLGWLSRVTQENIDYANAKGWTLTT